MNKSRRQWLAYLPKYRILQSLRDLLITGDKRISAKIRLFGSRDTFQPYGDTSYDRYPSIFSEVSTLNQRRQELNIISFGCSTGEEVFTLCNYFPLSTIVGLDISFDRIAICNERLAKNPNHRLAFFQNGSFQITSNSYDIIFAMAVFRHGHLVGSPETTSGLIDFKLFNHQINIFRSALKPSGLLVLRHCNFRIEDTDSISKFKILMRLPSSTPIYDATGHLFHEQGSEAVILERVNDEIL